MFYDNLKSICDLQNIKITPLVAECGGAKGSISNWKKGASPNSDIVVKLAVRLNVSTDQLLLGVDTSSQQKKVIDHGEEECLKYYRLLNKIDRIRIIEHMVAWYENYPHENSEAKEKGIAS